MGRGSGIGRAISFFYLGISTVTFAFCFGAQACNDAPRQKTEGSITYEISNPLEEPLGDIGFTISASEIKTDTAAIFDDNGRPLPVQWDDLDGDGQPDELFFLAGLEPGSTLKLSLIPGQEAPKTEPRAQVVLKTQNTPFTVEGARELKAPYVPQSALPAPSNLTPQNMWAMFEGPVWENGLIAYRFYLDSRNRTDIYGKQVSALVMDTVGWDYHDIQDWGADILKVGESLGIGSPAVWYDGKAHALEKAVAKKVEVVANGPLRNFIRTTFTGLAIDTFHMDLTWELEMHAGHHWTESRLKAETPLPEGMYFATGIVKHLPDFTAGEEGAVAYGYNWGPQSFHEQLLGMALMIKKNSQPRLQDSELDHLIIMEGNNQQAIYRFLAVWEKGTARIQSEGAFRQLLEKECRIWSAELNFIKAGGK